MAQQSNRRLHGLDLARFVALTGMVVVNFDVVMVAQAGEGNAITLASFLQGRAAATFVVLAGIGLGISSGHAPWRQTCLRTLKRAAFLFALGILNCLIFQADIIHYYTVYFFFALAFVRAPGWLVVVTIFGLALLSVVGLIWLDYDRGWNWENLQYVDFWTPAGFVRNLIFNGWHPLIPWLAFVLFGLLLARLNLSSRRVAMTLIMIGGLVLALTEWVSIALIHLVENSNLDANEREVVYLLDTLPIPPAPLYLVAGMSAASLVTGVCLLIMGTRPDDALLRVMTTTGRYTLTLYIAHIILGMGTLQALGLIGNASSNTALLASAVFCLVATVFSVFWSRNFRHGPMESLMHRATR